MGPQPSSSSVSSRFGLCAPKSTKSSPPLPSAAPKGHSDKRQSQDLSLSEVWSGSGWASMAPRVSLPQANCAEQLETEREHIESVRGEWRGRKCGRECRWGGGGGARTGRDHMCGGGLRRWGSWRGARMVESVRERGAYLPGVGGAYIQGPAGTLWQHGHGRAITLSSLGTRRFTARFPDRDLILS